MDKTLLVAVVVGLLSGAAGGYAVHALASRGNEAADEDVLTADSIEARLARIETKLDQRTQEEDGLTLEATKGALAAEAPAGARTLTDADIAALLAGMETRLAPTVKEAVKEATAEASPLSVRPPRPSKKRVPLAQAADELGLSAAEEDAVREVYADMADRFLKIVAGPEGDIEEVRTDLEGARGDPAKRASLMGKYLPKMLPRIGELMTLDQERRSGIEKAVGAEKAAKLEQGYTLEEQDPYGFGAGARMSIRR